MESSSANPTPQKVGPYRLDAWLGAGGMGTVWRAWDERLHRPVAIKHIQPKSIHDAVVRERFRREARATARLNHPAIVHLYDIIETAEGEWIVMELVEGESLSSILHDRSPLPFEEVLSLAQGIARGLAEAHAKGIVHRDLKADNVMVTPEHEAKILDFGLAKPLSQDMIDTSLTLDGQLVGTAQAMSPEQVMGHTVDTRSDLFSLGSLLYEMVSDTSPFKGATLFATMDRVCSHHPPPVEELRADVPRELSELIAHLLAKDPPARPGSAREVVARLRQIEDAMRMPAPATSAFAPFGNDFPTLAPAGESRAEMDGFGATAVHRPKRQVPESPPHSGFQPGERRQVTVICWDLLGEGQDARSREENASYSALDPEALYELMPEFQALAEETLARFEGCIGNILGHRIWAYFGYPKAHEDSAERAIRAALELGKNLERLEGSSAPGSFGKLALRTAIHTGPAVVGSPSGQLVLGQTLEIAMGLHGIARPQQVWVSEATHKLVADSTTWKALPPVSPTGFEKPIAVYRILEVASFKHSGIVDPQRDRLVARETELDTLLHRWRQAREGDGQVVFLSGEPGIGKSRIVLELEESLAAESPQWWLAYGTTYTAHSPLHPIAELLRRLLDFEDGDSTTSLLDRLEEILDDHGFSPREFVPLFAKLLGLPLAEKFEPLAASPERQRSRLMEALCAFFLERSERKPAVLVVEDLQWLDPSTLELLDLLIRQVPAVPLLAVLTFRTGFKIPWDLRRGVERLELEPLDARQAAQLVDAVATGKDLPSVLRREIVAQTDGVPLFVEEMTKAVLESELLDPEKSGEDTRPLFTIPATLKDPLAARLDRLGPTKVLAQEASVIGREFVYDVLVAVSSSGEGRVRRGLNRLVDSGLVYSLSGWRQRYLFQHALLRDAAYESLLSRRRRELHHRVAEVLESRAQFRVAAPPEVLAYHFTEAGVNDKAARFWLEAGQMAIERYANKEGIVHFERGLGVLRALPESPERDQLELAILSRLGPAASVVHGYGSTEVEKIYAQANALCQRFGTVPQVFWVLWGHWTFYLVRAELDQALELASQLTEIADNQSGDSESDRIFRLVALAAVALTHYFRGELDASLRHVNQAEQLDPPGRSEPFLSVTGQDTGVLVRVVQALVAWHQGHDARAVEKSEEAIALATRISHPYSLAFAQVYAARLYQSKRDAARCREHAETVISLSEQNGFFWLSQGYFFRGCSLAESRRRRGRASLRPGAVDRAAHFQRRGLDTYRGSGARLSQTYMLAQMVESALDAGKPEEARAFLDEAFTTCEEGSERFWQAELWRLRGELELATTAETGAAREAYRQALAISRERGDRAFELRAALSLARLLKNEGRGEEARALLESVCESFEESASRVELEEARSLMAKI